MSDRLVILLAILLTSCLPKGGGWSETATTWTEAPLPVCSLLDGSEDEMLGFAMDSWNKAAGCEIFIRGEQCLDGGVVVSLGATRWAGNRRIDGEAWLDRSDGTYYITLNTPATTTWNALILMHELGHVLGLGHDRSRMSVMTPGSHAPSRRMAIDRGPPWPVITHQDRGLVRGRYCLGGDR